jgi:hypothetical protein
MTINNYDIDEFEEGAIKLDGLDDAIIGVVEEYYIQEKKFLIFFVTETI